MTRNSGAVVLTALVAATIGTGGVQAQEWRTSEVGCEDGWGSRDHDRYCMVREASFDDTGSLSIDGGTNGGVSVEGWERDEIEIRAKVWGNARTEERAEEIASAVEIKMVRGRLSADGPETGRREGWGVSWEVRAPRATDLDIETFNGGVAVADVRGRIRFRALNGGVHLTQVGGDVRGRTTNGGLRIELSGTSWSGEGLDVETTNGGITLLLPEDFSARLETGTVNGGIDLGFPVTVQGRIGKSLTTTLGDGGPTIRAVTTNGGVKIERAGRAIR